MAHSAGALVALFGDELDEVGTARIGNTKMPGREVKVSARDLASAALALTVWDLVDNGALQLRTETKKRLFGSGNKMVLQANTAGYGFAGEVLAASTAETDVRMLVYKMLGGDATDPSSRLLLSAHAELAQAGAMVLSSDGKAKSMLKAVVGVSSFVAVPGAEVGLRPQWDALHARWAAWRAANPELHKQLLDAMRSAIQRATATRD